MEGHSKTEAVIILLIAITLLYLYQKQNIVGIARIHTVSSFRDTMMFANYTGYIRLNDKDLSSFHAFLNSKGTYRKHKVAQMCHCLR